ncbi:Peptide/nickel transport system substrate-binding protein [Candidatus Desulfarcum epimagneticum]|uniref:Peptide/nickel transport system substrate-binding protein n=1 Tax=uncultured Desulfobacteraceae bacterium TaxID=218296 RepID=A0A484HJ83_9BACT|nr:Peptide/nickel transport system substrate-binding protein [uncultured Desulfobacteraceae bacterium]
MGADKIHPGLLHLMERRRDKKMTRREFVRFAALLGVSAAGPATLWPGGLRKARADEGKIRRGGILKVASSLSPIRHPAVIDWIEPSNLLRQTGEYLTYTDHHNVTHPYLLESWKASADLKTWTLRLKKGVRFNNGDELTADDAAFSFAQWLDPDVGSSMIGLIGGYLSPSGVEKTGKYQLKLHLDRPEVGVPEHLFHYPAIVLNHRTFEGDFMKAPHGTGPYTIEEYREGELCRLKRRKDYREKGADGKPLPYLDGMDFVDMGGKVEEYVSALQSRKVHIADPGSTHSLQIYEGVKSDFRIFIESIPSANTHVLRMRVDRPPWDDNRVRTALKLCQHREKMLALAYHGEGVLGGDFHVCPIHPEYCEKPLPKFNPEKARALLKEAGYTNGLDVRLTLGDNMERYGKILKSDSKKAGFRMELDLMPPGEYNRRWKEPALGITGWKGRPLGGMALSLGYTADKSGNPVPWNETRWSDPEFDRLLKEANGTLDMERRGKIFCKLEDIQMKRGSIGLAWWDNSWLIMTGDVRGASPHPSGYMTFNEAWLSK